MIGTAEKSDWGLRYEARTERAWKKLVACVVEQVKKWDPSPSASPDSPVCRVRYESPTRLRRAGHVQQPAVGQCTP